MNYKNNLMYFNLSKFLFKEQYLIRFSLTETDLLHSLSNRSVSIIGNARSLNKNSFGSKIDKNDIITELKALEHNIIENIIIKGLEGIKKVILLEFLVFQKMKILLS